MAVFLSILFYVILIGILFDPKIQARAVRAFGRQPFGIPASVFAGLLQTVLYLPMPWAFYHFALIMVQARRDGQVLVGRWRIFLYLAEVERRHPHLARSLRICAGALFYFIAIVMVWTVYAGALGI